MKPYRQGSLDQLCGVYTVVNAVRAASLYVDRMPKTAGSELFGVLAEHLEARRLLAKALTYGVTSPTMSQLLQVARSWVEDRRGRRLTWTKPYHTQPQACPRLVIEHISRHLDTLGSAAIIGVYGRLEHWTVVDEVSEKSIKLSDSYGITLIRRRSLQLALGMEEQARLSLAPTCVFLLRLDQPD